MKRSVILVLVAFVFALVGCGDGGGTDANTPASLDELSEEQLAKLSPDLMDILDAQGSADVIVQANPQVIYAATVGFQGKQLEADPAVIWKARQQGAVIWKLTPEQAVIWKMTTDKAVIWKLQEKVSEQDLYVDTTFDRIHGLLTHVDASDVAGLAKLDEVAYISPDREVEVSNFDLTRGTVGTDMVTTRTGYDTFTGLTGDGIGVAVIDSGLYLAHTDFAGRISAIRNFSGEGGIYNAVDGYGHGTHVTGLIAGSGRASSLKGYNTTFEGVAPEVNIIVARVLNSQGVGSTSSVISALSWILAIKSQHNIRVANISLGVPPFESYSTDPMCQAVENAVANDLIVVTAAGNYGFWQGQKIYGAIASPGITPAAITVGASNHRGTLLRQQDANSHNDSIAFFSSRGPTAWDGLVKPDLIAPGWQAISTLAPNSTLALAYPGTRVDACDFGGSPCGESNADYVTMSGTSMSAPLVTGAIALMLEENPSLTPGAVKALVMVSAETLFTENSSSSCYTDEDWYDDPTCAAEFDIVQGTGLLNVPGATFLAGEVSAETNLLLPGDVWLEEEDITPTTEFDSTGETVVWSQGLSWTGKGIVGVDIWATFQQAYQPGEIWSQGLSWTGKGLTFTADPVFSPEVLAEWSTSFVSPYSLGGENRVLGGYTYNWEGSPDFSSASDAWFPEI
ncbi:MAG: S8 family peptidase [Candidatus Lernaella stagnicola]|nr:S8 family peptidase [Candidatus Lernaella stagnicola]